MSEKTGSDPQRSIRTEGGSVVEGDVHTGGDFVGRDKVTIGAQSYNFLRGDTEGGRQLCNRQAMLKLVHDIWVKGVLEHSLYNQLLIDLEMEQRPEAVERPWGMMLETPEQAGLVVALTGVLVALLWHLRKLVANCHTEGRFFVPKCLVLWCRTDASLEKALAQHDSGSWFGLKYQSRGRRDKV